MEKIFLAQCKSNLVFVNLCIQVLILTFAGLVRFLFLPIVILRAFYASIQITNTNRERNSFRACPSLPSRIQTPWSVIQLHHLAPVNLHSLISFPSLVHPLGPATAAPQSQHTLMSSRAVSLPRRLWGHLTCLRNVCCSFKA